MTDAGNHRRGWLLAALVVAGAATLYLGRLGDRALWSEEVRWAEIPREMARSGDLMWPTINTHTYYDKPLGSYWLVLAAAPLAGGVNELAARLPSAVAGVFAVGLLIALARRFTGDIRAAALAGAVLATSYGFAFFARTASSDVETVAGVLAALWVGTGADGRWSGRRTVAFWLVMAATSLTKGLLGFALPLLILGCYHTFAVPGDRGAGALGWARAAAGRNGWLLSRWTLPAAALAAAVYLAPFAVSAAQTGSAEGLGMVWRENVRRFFDAHNHRGPVYLYAYEIVALLAPWSLMLPAALVRAHQARDRGDRFALTFFWAVFVFFTLSSSRRSYYLLPVLPAAAFLVSRVVLAEGAELGVWARRLRAAGYALTAAGAVAAGLAAAVPASVLGEASGGLAGLPRPGIFLAGWMFVAACVGLTAVRRTPVRSAVSLATIAAWGTGYWFLAAQPDLEPYRTARPFLEHMRGITSADPGGVALYRTREAVWYLDPGVPLPECGSPVELADRLAVGSCRWALLKEQDLGMVAARVVVVLREPSHPWEGPAAAGRKMVLVEHRFGSYRGNPR
ncbi:MAG: phospholipid carrier-dependent glycosyltransferase [Gemmataceae bacterium]|nr:phospholipid carrier-dependent glycosyltransferase [Gemmataceae bacterium]